MRWLSRLIAPFFALAGLVLIPWTLWLTLNLPSRHETENWKTVWAGFDAALAAALLGTAVCALRRSAWLAPVAASAGTLLCVDAWFDITLESRTNDVKVALIEALAAELPLAAICFWIGFTSRVDPRAPDRA